MTSYTDVESLLTELRDEGLAAVGCPPEIAKEIGIGPSPNPEMGDFGFPCFALAKHLRKGPPMIAADVVAALQSFKSNHPIISDIVAAGPYVNIKFDRPTFVANIVAKASTSDAFGSQSADSTDWMIEFSAPNTNKPQHLGHIRNNLLGITISQILEFVGHNVTKVNLINDRGIHICKSMLAYQKFGEGETPESTEMKGDHLVGKYYVMFDKVFNEEYAAWIQTDDAAQKCAEWSAANPKMVGGQSSEDVLTKLFSKSFKDTYFNTLSAIGAEAKAMLVAWEDGDADVRALWEMMNSWVFSGFDETYERLGVAFDRVYKESETYLLGKDIVEAGVAEGKFKKLDDGAVACDLEPLGLTGEKILLRRDGTSVYMTQDLGTALSRFDEYPIEQMVYVVGNEQEYHFKVLFAILGLLRPELEGHLYHLSYGMVELPDGKMKSREGRVVDADDLIDEMIALATEASQDRFPDLSDDDRNQRAVAIGLAALKFYVLDFNPKTTVQFDPQKSISFEGRTGPYCLYTYARIQSIARKAGGWPEFDDASLSALGTPLEFALAKELQDWPRMVALAGRLQDPSKVTEQLFKICKAFSTLYNDSDHRIVDMEGARRTASLTMFAAVAKTISTGLKVIGIDVLEEM